MSQLSPPPAKNTTLLSNGVYNSLKHIAAIGLPALSALYYAISQIWHISHPGQIMATISAVNVCLGALLGISTAQYNNSDAKFVGNIEVMDTGAKKTYSLNLNADPEILDGLNEATFKINSVPPAVSTPQNPPQLGV